MRRKLGNPVKGKPLSRVGECVDWETFKARVVKDDPVRSRYTGMPVKTYRRLKSMMDADPRVFDEWMSRQD